WASSESCCRSFSGPRGPAPGTSTAAGRITTRAPQADPRLTRSEGRFGHGRCLAPVVSALDGSGDRQLEEERRAAASVRDDPDAAVHARHELAGDVEPEARAADAPRE